MRMRKPELRLKLPSKAPPAWMLNDWKSIRIPSNTTSFGIESGNEATPCGLLKTMNGADTDEVLAELADAEGAVAE